MAWKSIKRYRGLIIRSWRRWWKVISQGTRTLLSMESTRAVCARGDKCSFWHDSDERAKSTLETTRSSEPPTQRGRSASRKGILGDLGCPIDSFAKTSCKQFEVHYLVTSDTLPNVNFISQSRVEKFGNKCSFPHEKVEEQPNTMPKKGRWQKCSGCIERCATVELCISRRTAAGIFIDFNGRAQKSWDQFQFTKVTQRHADIRENKGPSLGKMQVKILHQRSPYAMKFEDKCQEEIWKTRAMRPRRRVDIGQEHLKTQRYGQSYLLLTCQRMEFTSSIRKENLL